jgi:L,D-transpeptidase catalytic domain
MRYAIRTAVLCFIVVLATAALIMVFARDRVVTALDWLRNNPQTGRHTVASRLAEIGPAAGPRLKARFTAAAHSWPPTRAALVAIKDQNVLELHARTPSSPWQLIHRYPIVRASGTSGPKLREGDLQVPEGIYRISSLNPNSLYHVSLRIDYPNAFDREMAVSDGRSNLGGDIMIHGRNVSVGCLAMGDEAAEELFVLAAEVTLSKLEIVIAPTDFRKQPASTQPGSSPLWLPRLYADIASKLAEFRSGP